MRIFDLPPRPTARVTYVESEEKWQVVFKGLQGKRVWLYDTYQEADDAIEEFLQREEELAEGKGGELI